jgi:hypothetical protein
MEKVKTSAVPIYFFRFEDLLLQPEHTLKEMFRFILAEKNLDGKIIEQRIKDVISGGKNFLYKPRSSGGGFHKHADKITKDQMADLMEKYEYYLHFFGYAKDERENQNPEKHVGPNGGTYNKFDFYDYNGKAKTENKDAYMDYLNVNEKMLNKRI